MNTIVVIGLILFGILVICLLVMVIYLVIMAAIDATKKTYTNCPHCGLHGRIQGFGRFSCAKCGKTFVADDSGKIRLSLGKMVFLYAGLIILMTGFDLYYSHSSNSSGYKVPVIAAILLCALQVGNLFVRKKFPTN